MKIIIIHCAHLTEWLAKLATLKLFFLLFNSFIFFQFLFRFVFGESMRIFEPSHIKFRPFLFLDSIHCRNWRIQISNRISQKNIIWRKKIINYFFGLHFQKKEKNRPHPHHYTVYTTYIQYTGCRSKPEGEKRVLGEPLRVPLRLQTLLFTGN